MTWLAAYAQTAAGPDPPNLPLLGAARGGKAGSREPGRVAALATMTACCARRYWLLPSGATAVSDPAFPLCMRRGAQDLAGQGQQLFERSEFCWTPPNSSTAGSPTRKRGGADSGGDFFFVSFSCSHKKK